MISKPMPGVRALNFVAALVLLVGILPWPIEYYSLLRVIVCGATAYSAFKLRYRDGGNQDNEHVPLVFMAMAFNPITPIFLPKLTWVLIDLAGATWLFRLNRRIGQGQLLKGDLGTAPVTKKSHSNSDGEVATAKSHEPHFFLDLDLPAGKRLHTDTDEPEKIPLPSVPPAEPRAAESEWHKWHIDFTHPVTQALAPSGHADEKQGQS